MAQKINVVMIDDTDGSTAEETVQFGLDGKAYEIDLSSKNAEGLRKMLEAYVAHARPSRIRATPSRPRPSHSEAAKVREWAKERGIHVNERGRIPASLMEEYRTSSGSKVV